MIKKGKRAAELVVFSVLQYGFLPILCGFLTMGVLKSGVLAKLGLNRFDFINFPTIKLQATTVSTYSGLMLVSGLGCLIGMILSRFMKFGARLGHFDFISPPLSQETMPIPSVTSFIRSIVRLAGIPVIVILAAVTSRMLAITGMLPGVSIDTQYQSFDVTLLGVVIIAGLGCLIMFVYDMILSTLLRMTKRKEVELKELG